MKTIKIIIGVVLAVLIAAGIVAVVKMGPSSSGGGDDDDATAPAENETNIVTVQIAALTNITLHRYVDGYGMVEAMPATADKPAAGGTLAAPSAGVVKKINVVSGQQVNEGDVLAQLDSSTATFEYAQDEVKRQQTLFSHQNTSVKNVNDAKAQLKSLEVIAPVSGTVTSVNVKPGQAVDSTTVVAEVIDLKRLAVGVKIPADQAADLQTGQDVQILTDPPVSASLSFVSPAVDSSDGTVAAWAALPADSTLRPGQFVRLKIVTAQTNCLAAPAASVVTDDSGNSTVAKVNGKEADQTPVQTGFREGDWVGIQATNLNAGDQVVTVGAYGLADKTQIKIQNTPDDNSATNSADAK